MHTHRAQHSDTRPFTGPVSRRENPTAHGNVTIVETCACGATRRTNVNQEHIERGAWNDHSGVVRDRD